VNAASGQCAASVTYTPPVGTDNCGGATTAQIAGLGSGASFPVGTTTNTFRVTDGVGNTATCSFTVTVIDNQAPAITCPANISVNASSGQCSAVVTYTAPTGTDNCAGASTTQTAGLTSGATFPVGVTTNTFRVTALNGTTATCSFTVTVIDNQGPAITCPANISVNASSGQCSAVVTYTAPTGTDNCAGASTTQIGGLASGATYPVGVTTNTFRVTALNGTTATCSFTVTVIDNQAPTITCPANISVNASSGVCSAVVTYTAPTGTDNCAGATTAQTVGLASGATYTVGVTTNTFQVTALNGATATCSFTVTVVDNQAPVITCPANTTVNATSGACSAVVTYTAPTGTDNCAGASTTQIAGLASGATFPVGVTTNTFRVTALNGTTATCSFTVTVIDNQAPTITCPANQSISGTSGAFPCTAPATYVAPVGADNCPGATTIRTVGLASGSSFPQGVNTVTYQVTAANGATSTCSFTITVGTCNSAPIAVCQNVTVSANGSCQGVVLPSQVNNGSSDPNGDPMTFVLAPAGPFALGTTNVTLTVSDPFGLSSSCNAIVTVVDNQVPAITCPANMSVNAGVGTCNATVTYTAPTGTDNCSGPTTAQIVGLGSGASFPIGTTVNTFRVTDGAGNTATCSFTVNVIDNQAPIITCPSNIILSAVTNTCAATATYSVPVGTDNCPGATTNQSTGLTSGSSFPVGTTVNTFVVTAGNGATTSCAFTVTVTDNQAPTIVCPANITTNATTGQCAAVVNYATPTGTDNCPGAVVSVVSGFASGTSFPVGTTTNTFRVTDASGATASCSFTVTVIDNQAPSIICPSNIVVNASPGLCSAPVSYTTPVGTDNCPGVSTSQTSGLPSGSTFPVGVTNNSFKAIASNGVNASCSFTITVVDNQAPVINCPANISVNNAFGQCGSVVNYSTPTGTDNCPGANTIRTAGLASGSFFPVGTTINTFRVTAANGAFAVCSFSVTVVDNQLPIISCPSNITVNSSSSSCSAPVSFVTPIGSDNCPGAVTTQISGFASGSLFPVGTTTNTFLVTAAGGSTASCSFTVTAIDNQAPLISCPANITTNAGTGTCAANVSYIVPVGTDNCPGASTALIGGLTSGASFPVGVTTNTFRVTDAFGNSGTCSFTVTVIDNQLPVVVCPSSIIVNAASNTCTAVVSYTAPTGADNCPGSITAQIGGLASGATFPVGVTTNIFRATDASGNSATCSFTVTVVDNQPPAITCPANISVNASLGLCAATVTFTTPGGTDNCSGSVTTQIAGLSSGTSFPVGVTTNTFSVTDGSSNSATCSFTVTVVDNQPPTIACPANINVNASLGICAANVSYSTPVGADNCAGTTVSQTVGAASGASFPIGTTTNTFRATDAAGNTSTCSFTVTVIDNQAPAITCPSNISVNNSPGFCNAVVTYTAPVGTDNCPGQTTVLTSGLASGATYPIGTTTNVYTVTDAGGNSTTCSFTVTVNAADMDVEGAGNLIVDGDLTPTTTDLTDFGTPFPGVPVVHTFEIENDGTAPLTISTITMAGAQAVNFTVGGISLPITILPGDSTTFTVTFVATPIGVYNATVVINNNDCNSNPYDFAVTGEVSCLPAAFTTCPSNQTVNTALNLCTQVVNYVPVIVGAPSPTVSYAFTGVTTGSGSGTGSGSTFNLGVTTVTLTASNVCGSSSCSFTLTVNDLQAPNAICQNVTVQLDNSGNGSITASSVNNGSNDACGILSVSVNPTTFNCSNVSPAPLTELFISEYVEGNGNNKYIELYNPTAGPINLANYQLRVYSNGSSVGTPANTLSGTLPAGGTVVYRNSGATIYLGSSTAQTAVSWNGDDAIGVFNTVTNQFADIFGRIGDDPGTAWTATGTSTLDRTLRRKAIVNRGVTVSPTGTGPNAFTTLLTEWDAFAVDNVAGLGAHVFIAPNTAVLTVTDVNGNTSTCSATVTVEDNVAPVASLPECDGPIEWMPEQVPPPPPPSTTAAPTTARLPTLTLSQSAFVCAEVGANTEILTVTDVNGNSSTCSTTITVEDNVAPVAICQNITVQLDVNGSATITASQINNASTDACGIAGLAVNTTTFTCANINNNTVILTVTDVNGNSSTCSATVNIDDNVAPIATCQNVTVQLNGSGTGSATAAAVNNGSTDNCAIATLTLSQSAFVCAEVGANTEILTVTDVNGNSSTCSTTITVEDNVAPNAICQNITVQLNNTGNGSTTAAAVNNGSTDACGIQSLTLSQTAFVCAEVGANTEVLTVTDVNGNSSTCSTTITVEDNVAPVAICQNITVQLDVNGSATITASQVNNASTDACGIAGLALNTTTFTCANINNNTVILTVTDVNGNSSTCSATVSIDDNVAPVAICQSVTVQLDNTGNGSTTAAAVNNGSTDNCAIAYLEP
jgi:hypothetical protein